jgi:hypothetical protein
LADTILPALDADLRYSLITQLKDKEWMCVSLDGWSDVAKLSYYAVMLLKGEYLREFVDSLSLTEKRHTAENLLTALEQLFSDYEVEFKQVCSIVSDSPTVMKKLRRILGERYPHIVGVGYVNLSYPF